jgi:hypothetical protein
MPLYSIDTPHYLNRKRVFIDTDLRNQDLSNSPYDAVYNLPELYEKVQSIELVGFNIPRSIFPTFVQETVHEDGTRNAGNNLLDIRLRDVPFTRELVFTVAFPEGYFRNSQEIADIIPDLFETTMDAQGDPFFNTGAGVGFTANIDVATGAGGLLFTESNIGGNPNVIAMEYLFQTGANKGNSAWKVLGFQENQDIGGYDVAVPIVVNDPFPPRVPLLTPP